MPDAFTQPTMPDAADWFERYIQTFFSGEALQRMMTYMCDACTTEISDPVCSTLTMFMSTPVVFCVTGIGLIPFRNTAMAVMPFSQMTPEQREFLLGYIDFTREAGLGVPSTQMGGGCVLSLTKNAISPHHLDHVTVLSMFFRTVLDGCEPRDLETRMGVCNIVLQRLGAAVNISRDNIQRVHALVLRPAAARRDTLASTPAAPVEAAA